MSDAPRGDVRVGDELPELTQTATLATSVQYAGASGDLNPLHYDPQFAADVSPTGEPIAHGMYAMGLVSRLVTGWAGGPEHVEELRVRFRAPWPLGATATFTGSVTAVDDGTASLVVVGRLADDTRFVQGTATVRTG